MTQRVTLVVILAVTLGCGQPVGENVSRPSETKEEPSGASTLPSDSVRLQILDQKGLGDLLANRQGRVVVMDVWSTSCPPCVKEFPKLVALHRRYGPDQLACVSVSYDFDGSGTPDDVFDKVLSFLVRQQATFDNVLSSVESNEIMKHMGIYSGPAVFVYDRDGTLAKKFDTSSGEAFTYEEVEQIVKGLL